ncbi:MAG: hypothetical protein ACE5OP_12380 [Candidatus Glassbacteria bacterium]
MTRVAVNRFCAISGFAAFLFLFLIGDAKSTTLIQKDLDDLIIESEHIILGTVIAKSSDWSVNYAQRKSLIYTTYTIKVEQAIKGEDKGTLQFRTVGGQSGSCLLHVPGVPHFDIGERTILFLRSQIPDAICDVVGFEQGRYTVIEDTVVENGMKLNEFLAMVSGKLNR